MKGLKILLENTTDKLFWTLSTIIVGALMLTIGIHTFPKATSAIVRPFTGLVQQADVATNNISANIPNEPDLGPQSQQVVDQMSQLSKQNQEYENQLNTLRAEMSKARTQSQQKDQTIDSLHKQLSVLSQQISSYQKQHQTDSDEINSLHSQVTSLSQQVESLQSEKASIQEQYNKVKEDDISKSNELAQALKDNQAQADKITDLTNQNHDLSQKVQDTLNAKQDVESKLSQAYNDLNNLKMQFNTLSADDKSAHDQLDTQNIQINSLNAQISNLQAKLDANKADMNQNADMLKQLQDTNNELKITNNVLQNQIQQDHNTIEDLKEKLDNAKEDAKTAQDELDTIKQQKANEDMPADAKSDKTSPFKTQIWTEYNPMIVTPNSSIMNVYVDNQSDEANITSVTTSKAFLSKMKPEADDVDIPAYVKQYDGRIYPVTSTDNAYLLAYYGYKNVRFPYTMKSIPRSTLNNATAQNIYISKHTKIIENDNDNTSFANIIRY